MAAVSPFPPNSDRPTPSKVRKAVERQMPLVEKAEPIEVDKALIHRQKSMTAAIALCVQAAGLAEKEVYLPLGIDASHWTRISKGDAHFPLELLGPLMDLCGNEAPLEWLAHSRGYELRPLESELERQVRMEQERNADMARELEILRGLLLRRP